ncbi:MAG: response regulator transcription factor [Deltaproteobacteria bacterium]|nr:response regulator transcription factor [Deltaproteobacteria bacterium]
MMDDGTITVALTDDHVLVREGLRRLLEEQHRFDVVGEAADGEQTLLLLRQLKPDVVLLDISMPNKDGIDTTREIVAEGLPTKVLILTMHADEHYASRALRAGAHGFILKDAKAEELVAAIEQVHAGGRYLPPELARAFADRYLHDSGEQPSPRDLSRREREVLCLLAQGLTNREVADRLVISVKTVDSHRGNLLKKLNLRNNSDITRFAIQHGLVRV